MNIKLLFAIHCFCLFTLSISAQTKEVKRVDFAWEKLVPLVTKKAEIEKHFGQPIKSGYISLYEIPFAKISVWYVGTKEPDGLVCNWKVSEDTANSFSISLGKGIPISTIKFNLNEFERGITHLERIVYTSLEKGISFVADKTVDGEEEIYMIQYFPSSKDIKKNCVQKGRDD